METPLRWNLLSNYGLKKVGKKNASIEGHLLMRQKSEDFLFKWRNAIFLYSWKIRKTIFKITHAAKIYSGFIGAANWLNNEWPKFVTVPRSM